LECPGGAVIDSLLRVKRLERSINPDRLIKEIDRSGISAGDWLRKAVA